MLPVKIRKIIFWSHLVVGVSTGVVVLMLAVTGVLLTYEVQLTRWAENSAGIEPTEVRLGADELAEAARLATGGRATALVFEHSSTVPVAATMGRDGRVLLDPYTGSAVGGGDTAVGRFFGAVTGFHRWLSFTGFSGLGKTVTGAANLGFLFLALSGAYLWLPRVWKWARLKTLILFRRDYPNAQARDFHWHHIFAFWSVIPLVVIIATGVTMSYERAEGVVMTLVGVGDEEDAPPRPGGAPGDGAVEPVGAGLAAVLAVAKAHDPAWNRVVLTLPTAPEADTVTVVVDTGPGRRMTRQETLTIGLDNARVIAVESFGDRPKAVRTFMFLRFAHTGEHYGVVGQTIAGLASLATVFMVYTGLALAWRRLITPLLRRRRQARGV